MVPASDENSPLLLTRHLRGTHRMLKEGATACVPENNPSFWTLVNFILCLWSIVLVYEILGTEGPLERRYGQQLYLIWNFGSTIAWCFEIGLTVWHHHVTPSRSPIWSDRLQLGLAVYFLIDSILLFKKWTNPDKKIDDELIDVIINSLSYLAILISTAKMWYHQKDVVSSSLNQQELLEAA